MFQKHVPLFQPTSGSNSDSRVLALYCNYRHFWSIIILPIATSTVHLYYHGHMWCMSYFKCEFTILLKYTVYAVYTYISYCNCNFIANGMVFDFHHPLY